MNKETSSLSNNITQLADDARALMNATGDVAGEKVSEARQRLAAALGRGQEVYGRVREQAVASAKVADQAVHQHPYQAIAIGVGIGALIGYVLASRCARNRQ